MMEAVAILVSIVILIAFFWLIQPWKNEFNHDKT